MDLYEGEKNTENNNFPPLFSSLEKAVEKVMVVAEIILTDEQKKNVVEKAQQIIDDERKAKEIKVKSSEKEQEKLINALERILLEKEIKKLQKTKNSGEETGKFPLCYLCHLVKKYLSKKETETASNQDLATNIDERIQENNQMAQIEVSSSSKN